MSHLSQKLSELQPFSWVKPWQNLKSKEFPNLKISHVKSIYISESIHKVSRSSNNLEPLNWIRALCVPPRLLPGSRTLGLIGLRTAIKISSDGTQLAIIWLKQESSQALIGYCLKTECIFCYWVLVCSSRR